MFKLVSDYEPTGDQPQAIDRLVEGIKKGYRFQTLIGVTGSGKTFTMANVISRLNRPALVISPNKTLAAQLYGEFKTFFPHNRVEYFISYYDYYQPEAYVPTKDLYIEKNADINDVLVRMRMSALKSVRTRRDVVVVASVSSIYASGDPSDFDRMNIQLSTGLKISPHAVAQHLAKIGYERSNEITVKGCFRLRGDVLEIYPTYQDEGIRIEFFGSVVDRIETFDKLNRSPLEELQKIIIYPAIEFVTTEEKLKRAVESIKNELDQRLTELKNQGKILEAQRLQQRTMHDLELLSALGYCPGIENYSRHFDGRKPGEPPYTLLDYFDDDVLVFLDESHIAVPQLRAMWRGEHSRKKSLVEYGFRLPSAFDNRPLTFEEFLKKVPQIIFVSATPGPFEYQVSEQIVEQIIRPTGLIDPEVEVRPTKYQVDDLISEIKKVVERGERALITVLTKKTAEKLSEYLVEMGIKSLYIHSELDAIERIEVLKKLRRGDVDAVVGINLLREGLDLPEVSLVAILDSDKEGFLRSETTLIQIIGRVARNLNGKVLMYADRVTPAMQRAIDETNRRRKIQMEYNEKYGITPKTIVKPLQIEIFEKFMEKPEIDYHQLAKDLSKEEYLSLLEEEMYRAASELRYEDAAKLRDEIFRLREELKDENYL
ncbi:MULTISPECIES: excinuclease ABC subunit UvrB [Pseudothermotoga]|jgi:excinuclease ABC subunit B|uniref:UvrABC system protein B n=1 Tax=Pseudothermotoga lettingae (strain ATCC BAA-301 / DSM 14385 / NBRC 107922 / TMO) TaxID=416591 RepID=UVRB_PSELT|nr:MULTISPECIES: excinuclease ABC subunit UvrB [Pseudothermotoga]A8F8W9.1 RecName: Full=UvrABC system protein B; Short=Protein UvrB; AltName: Full=Excinuclease ABC subunit B [Pseudothermotoga lettingae TMO]ABV34603.1 excinuclease ABC, B subunit [Pseudothermotoga lettingae TMO]KUK21290.1 MAG: UvrABC system protein B [Pseudothermotoga lettingae]MDI3494793.1 excinuclease subunit [Pseudothermotoga sp.]MDK2883451.1 excinuclease subunit [Pseudothermotoga sp.]GLI48451.1 UvrABC system protein B [Pseu